MLLLSIGVVYNAKQLLIKQYDYTGGGVLSREMATDVPLFVYTDAWQKYLKPGG